MGSNGLDRPLAKNIDSNNEDFPQLFFPKKRLICLNPSIEAYLMPLNRSISILLNITDKLDYKLTHKVNEISVTRIVLTLFFNLIFGMRGRPEWSFPLFINKVWFLSFLQYPLIQFLHLECYRLYGVSRLHQLSSLLPHLL